MQSGKLFGCLATMIVGVAALCACGSTPPPDHQVITTDDHFGSPDPNQATSGSAHPTLHPSGPQSVELCGPKEVRVMELDQQGSRDEIRVTVCVKGKNVWVATADKALTAYRYISLSPLLTDGKGVNVQATVLHGATVAYLTDLDPKHPMCGQDLGTAIADSNGIYTITVTDLIAKHHCAVIIPDVK